MLALVVYLPGGARASLLVPGESDKDELAKVIKDQLQVQLQDPINDLEIIFDSLDDDKSGLVSMEEVSRDVRAVPHW
jgi:hypothetical protein